MKIAVSGTQCMGKSTFIKDFINKWSMYKQAGEGCSSIILKQNLLHSKDSDEKTQEIFLNYLIDIATAHTKDEYIIYDRCVLDNLAYTMWLFLNKKVSETFLNKTVTLTQQTLKLYDIIFFTPLTKVSPVDITSNGVREIDPIFREEINNIFTAMMSSYYKGDRKLFPITDCPAVIEIFGKPDERIKLAEFYINENGNMFGEDESLITIPAEFDPELQGII